MIRTEIMEPRQSYSNGYNLNKSSNNNSSSNNNDSLNRKRHSYSTLFDLDSIRNFNLPRDDDSDGGVNYPSSSPDQSAGDKAYGAEHANGYWHGRSSEPRPDSNLKRKRSHVDTGMGYNVSAYREEDSNDEDDGISEGYYRNMLGEHLAGKYYKKTRLREEQGQTPGLGTNALMDNAYSKRGSNNKARKFAHESSPATNERNIVPKVEVRSSEFHPTGDDSITRRNDDKVDSFTSGYLDVTDRVSYKVPPFYDKLAPLLNLPSFFELEIEESFLIDRLDLKTLSKLVPSVKHNEHHNHDGVVEPIAEFNSLQEKLKALKASNAGEVFKLQVLESDLLLMQQEAMGTKRLIMSETGTLQYCYVKVLEKGDGYEIIERKLPRKTPIKKDPLVVEKEDIEKVAKVWNNIIKRDLQKHYKTFLSHARKQTVDAKKIADFCQKEVKSRTTRSLKLVKAAAIRTKRLTKDMLVFWKRIDKEQSEIRKREEKEAAEALKRQEELREQKRHQQRLNFLISQTELYSHFMQNKTQETSDPSAEDTAGHADEEKEQNIEKEKLAGKEEEDEEEAALKEEALRNAKKAVSEQKKITSEFDNDCLKFRIGSGDDIPEGSKNMDLHNPSSMPITSSVQQPSLFEGTLKEYQLKGLQWLVNCYEQGLNGILADEMGLGKTIQAVSFLAHLAEEKNIWGPFLIVAPSSVLNNWVDEFKKFCPDLRPLPYWGKNSERAVLRKSIHRKNMYRRESKYHIVVTSYQLIVQDEKCFKRVKWQYMILDEAQAIKSSMSIRWKTLLAFNCRNRLLLTGTPIQNNMAELWALLHFIMPTLFDSHEQFNEWFSKGIENHAEHGGTLNEHQLNRLHAILKPFMLRRLKKDVIAEMCSKKEVTVDCTLSSRQQAFYRAIKNKISVAELININDKKVANLMNIVIQLRKVCNHPELFERNEGRTFMYFCKMTNQLLPPPFGALEDVHYAGGGNPILYKIPKLVYRESILDLPNSRSMFDWGIRQKWLNNVLNIFSPNNIHRSLFPPQADSEERFPMKSGTFGFSRLIDLSPAELSFLANGQILERLLYSLVRWSCQFLDSIVDNIVKSEQDDIYQEDQIEEEKVRAVTRMLMLPTRSDLNLLRRKLATGPRDMPFEGLVVSHHDRFLNNIKSLKAIYSFIPPTRAPPIDAICSDRGFAYQQQETFENPWFKRLLVGQARTSEFNGPSKPKDPHPLIQEIDSSLPAEQPVLKLTNRIFGSSPPLQTFDLAKMLTDSGKLHTLDALLKRLRAENHRVLLFAQMTKMLNILEDYMNYRKYRYRRLDGSSSVAERRETVKDFQEREDIFVFLLSTRAGGIGINLTAADTVIFYESDWNPTLDLQAMDRAHRLGQTKEVTVYRLICKETIEEKILLRASQKNTVQQLVMTGGQADGNVAADVYSAEDVRSLLLDDPELEQKLKEQGSFQAKDKQRKRLGGRALRLNEDGDMFLAADDEGALLNNLPQNNVNKKRKHNSEAAAASSKRSKKNTKKVTNKKGTSEPQPEMF